MHLITERGIGIFNLETTNYPLISEHADTLQPLWKSARRLSENETTAEQEIAAVFDQIQSALTAQQRQAISVTELSILDMGVIAEDLGLDFGMGQLAELNPELQATMQAARESGQGHPADLAGL